MSLAPVVPQSDLPWGLYVHVPWCRRRCPYCDFAFDVGRARKGFATRVLKEIEARRGEMPAAPARTLSFGGGTPTALPLEEIALIIAEAKAMGAVAVDAEVALEGNPEDLGTEGPARLGESGLTRLSIGVQSFDDAVLHTLGRGHSGAEAEASVKAAVSAGLKTSLDLIVGVPNEPAGRLETDLNFIRALEVGHVSAYLLTIEPNTPWVALMARGQRDDVDHDRQADALEHVQQTLETFGLRQYEISSHAIEGEESEHNRLYWAKGHYLGVGPSAHSLTVSTTGEAIRRSNASDVDAYFLVEEKARAFETEVVSAADAFREAVAFGLRDLGAGISLPTLVARHQATGEQLAHVDAALAQAVAAHHVVARDGIHRLTSLGARFADAVARNILDDQGGVPLQRSS